MYADDGILYDIPCFDDPTELNNPEHGVFLNVDKAAELRREESG
jgi:hypothetical protein